MVIKQISFDFWNTLFRANPAYGEARNKYLTESSFNCNGLSSEEVYAAYKRVDARIDWVTDRTGYSYAPIQLYGMVAYELGCQRLHEKHFLEMGKSFAYLFKALPPTIYSPDTVHALKELSSLGYQLSIGSNTGFIPGAVIRDVCLPMLEVDFNFGIYSDEIIYAKPHAGFYSEIHTKACGKITRLTRKQILHVGDNFLTDLAGAYKAGFGALLINNGKSTINDVMTHVSHAQPV